MNFDAVFVSLAISSGLFTIGATCPAFDFNDGSRQRWIIRLAVLTAILSAIAVGLNS